MAVYVDDARNRLGRMIMCHMIADTRKELLDMVKLIQVKEKWLQKKGTYQEHFDICWSKRKLAIQAGAKPVSSKELVRIMLQKPFQKLMIQESSDGSVRAVAKAR